MAEEAGAQEGGVTAGVLCGFALVAGIAKFTENGKRGLLI